MHSLCSKAFWQRFSQWYWHKFRRQKVLATWEVYIWDPWIVIFVQGFYRVVRCEKLGHTLMCQKMCFCQSWTKEIEVTCSAGVLNCSVSDAPWIDLHCTMTWQGCDVLPRSTTSKFEWLEPVNSLLDKQSFGHSSAKIICYLTGNINDCHITSLLFTADLDVVVFIMPLCNCRMTIWFFRNTLWGGVMTAWHYFL